MKYALFFFLTLIPTKLFALPCPNGSGILYKGDSIEEVIKQCGEPTSKQSIQKIVSTMEEWIYYRSHYFDAGYTQVGILFENGLVKSIRINEINPWPLCKQTLVQAGPSLVTTQLSCGNVSYNTGATNLCSYGITIGQTKEEVLSSCGNPQMITPLQNQIVNETEFSYGGQGMIFQNGRLVEWR